MKRKQDRSQIEKFQRDTQWMTSIQKFEYINMSESERIEYVASIKPVTIQNVKPKEEIQIQKDIPVKIIKPGQVCVHVLNMRGKPLMPTSPRKARLLLKNKKAKVVRRNPFTVQLKYATGENRQPIILAIDPGYKNVGFSAVTEKRELISGEVILRTDIPEKLLEKKMYRRGRRNRNTRYRKPRFENRHIKEGWLAPSIQHKLDTYVRLVDKFQHILPISSINIETSPFDTQKM